ncbi:MAG: hypothetical protein WAU50_01725 [Candidatus Sulfotelmatobacter sp.]
MNRFFQFLTVAFFATCLAQAQVYGPPAYGPPAGPGHSALVQRAAEMGTGKWWIRLSDDAKDKLIERYTKAMNHVQSDLFEDCTVGGQIKSVSEEVDIVSSMILCNLSSSFDFNFDHKELREGVDGFYKDSTNLAIPIDVALQRVRDVLAAKRPRGQGHGIG